MLREHGGGTYTHTHIYTYYNQLLKQLPKNWGISACHLHAHQGPDCQSQGEVCLTKTGEDDHNVFDDCCNLQNSCCAVKSDETDVTRATGRTA
jgi:hypothetical protein